MISIIVPVYNAEKFILETIDTVRSQSYTDWELLLVDDRSKDNSVSLIRQRIQELHDEESTDAEKIRLICLEQNGGAARARNAGIDAAQGRYIAFLDADDIWRTDKLEKEIQYMEKNHAGFVFTAYEFGDENAKPNGRAVRVPKHLTYQEALARTIIFTSTVLIDTAIVDKELIHMPSIGSEDTATWWQILKTGIIAYGLDQPLVIYRRPPKSLSSNKGTAVKRIWNLYRNVAGMTSFTAAVYMVRWAWRATVRRFIADTIRAHIETLKRFTAVQLSMIGLLLHTAVYAYTWFTKLYPMLAADRYTQEGFYIGPGIKLYYRGHILILLVYFAILLFISKNSGGLRTGHLKPGSIFGSEVVALLITNILTYFQLSLMRNWLIPVHTWVMIFIVQAAIAAAWSYLADFIYQRVFPPREILVIGLGDSADISDRVENITQLFHTRRDRFNVTMTMHYEGDLEPIRKECLRWYGGVAISGGTHDLRRQLCEFCYNHYIRVYMLPEIGDMLVNGTEYLDMFDTPILELKEYSARWEDRVFKRITDFVIGLVGLIICSPWLLIRMMLGDRIATERCMGKDGKEFLHYHFQNHSSGVLSLLNLVNGKMSLIGPAVTPYEQAQKEIEEDGRYFYRYRMKPGMTGYSRLYGNGHTAPWDLLKMDIYYIQHFSLLNDFKLMLQSLRIH